MFDTWTVACRHLNGFLTRDRTNFYDSTISCSSLTVYQDCLWSESGEEAHGGWQFLLIHCNGNSDFHFLSNTVMF